MVGLRSLNNPTQFTTNQVIHITQVSPFLALHIEDTPMSTTAKSSTNREASYFEQQRAALVGEVAMVPTLPIFSTISHLYPNTVCKSLEHVLQNLNRLNRNLEGIIAVGNEFSSVEALWSQFENVMAKDGDPEAGQGEGEEGRVEER